MDERRPDPEELLKQIKQEEIAKQRGENLKNIFLATQRVLERLMPCWKQLMLLIMPVSM